MIILIVSGVICLYIIYRLKKKSDKYKHIPGVSLLEFFKDPSNLPGKTAQWRNEKLARIDTPIETMVLATHPDSAKVNLIVCTMFLN